MLLKLGQFPKPEENCGLMKAKWLPLPCLHFRCVCVCVLTSDQESSNDFLQEGAELRRWGWREEKHCFTAGRKGMKDDVSFSQCYFTDFEQCWIDAICQEIQKQSALIIAIWIQWLMLNMENNQSGFVLFFMSPTFVVSQDSRSASFNLMSPGLLVFGHGRDSGSYSHKTFEEHNISWRFI